MAIDLFPNLYSTCSIVDTVYTHIPAVTVSSRPQAIHCLRDVLMISSYGDNEGTTTTIYPYKRIKADAELYKGTRKLSHTLYIA